MKLRQNNRGSSIVLVLVVLALVSVFATVALTISLTNFQMKVTDSGITDSFYSAESVLDQICAGLEVDVSEAVNNAYTQVMVNYASLEDENERTSYFSQIYVYTLRNKLMCSGVVDEDGNSIQAETLCDLNILRGYLPSSGSGTWELHSADNDNNTDYCELVTASNSLTIKNLVVEYTDSSDYLSIIQTDIVIAIPEMNMISQAQLPDLFSYSIIGNGGVAVTAQNVTVDGSVYAGSAVALDVTGAKGATDYASLVIGDPDAENSAASVTFCGDGYVVADGDVEIYGNGSQNSIFTTAEAGQLWARNILVKHAAAQLSGTTYVKDDLILRGAYPSVSLENGTYVGYSSETTAADVSSAIVLNGTHSTLDMSKAKAVLVNGYSYIGTGNVKTPVIEGEDIPANSDVQTGESIAVKGDQIAYLVPESCVGTRGSGEEATSEFGHNPISYTEYKTILENPDTYTLVNENVKIARAGDKSLAEYKDSDEQQVYTLVFVPSLFAGGEGQVYIYLNLSAEKATEYFQAYYSYDDTKLLKYTAFYSDAIKAVENANIYTAGTYAVYDKDESGTAQLSYLVGGNSDLNSGASNYSDEYDALTSYLTTDYSLAKDYLNSTVFDNIIQKTAFDEFFTKNLQSTVEKTIQIGNDTMTAILAKEDYTFDKSAANAHYLLIVDGNVTIKSGFSGTIIASGKVTMEGAGATIENTSEENMLNLLSTSVGEDYKVRLYSLFVNGSSFNVSNGFGDSGTGNTIGTGSSVSELISLHNWQKK